MDNKYHNSEHQNDVKPDKSDKNDNNSKKISNKPDTSAPVTEFSDKKIDKEVQNEEQTSTTEKQNEELVTSLKDENNRLRDVIDEQKKEIAELKKIIQKSGKDVAKKNLSNWWEKLYEQIQQKRKYDVKAAEGVVREYPSNVIELCYKIQNEVNSVKGDLVQEKKHWSNVFTGNHTQITKLEKKITTLEDQSETAKEIIETLEEKEKNYVHIQKQNSDLELRCTRLIKEITSLKTDEDTTAKHDSLYKYFKELKEQKFKELSNKIYKLHSKCFIKFPKSNRKEETAKIRSKIAKNLLLEEVKITDIDHEKIVVSLQDQLIKYCCDEINNFKEEKDEINQSIKNLAEESFQLVKNISHALPPGKLLWREKNQEFNPEEHEAIVGCAEHGMVNFTVYPGYVISEGDTNKQRIFAKVLVFTTLE